MLLRISSRVFQISWWIFVAAIVLLAAVLIIGRVIVLTISDGSGVETLLHDRGFEYVSLGEVDSGWRVHNPTVRVEQLTFSPEGVKALEVDLMTLQVDMFRSLFSATPIVTDIELEGVRFTVEGRNDGSYGIRGFGGGDGFTDLDLLLDSLPHIESVQFSGVDISLEGQGLAGHLISSSDKPMLVSADGDRKHLSFPLTFEPAGSDGDAATTVHVMGMYEGHPRKEGFIADLFLETIDLELSPGLRTIRVSNRRIETAILNSKTWIRIDDGTLDVTGLASVSNVKLGGASVADTIDVDFRFVGDSWNDGTLGIPQLRLRSDEFQFSLDDIYLAVSDDDGGSYVAGNIETVNVTELASLLDYAGGLGLVPERLQRALSELAPAGNLEDVLFTLGNGEQGPRLVSSLNDLSIDAYLGVPSINQLNGLISIAPEQGHIDIHNESFEMYFSNMFQKTWPFDGGRGRVAYNLQDGTLRLNSGLIELIHGDLSAHGKVSLNLPPERAEQTWGLTIGIRDADLLTADRYIPNTITQDLRSWLENAIRGGDGIETGLTFHGALFRGAPGVRKTHDLFFQVEDTTLNYHDDWPNIEGLSATVHVNSYFVASDDASGRVYNSDIVSANVMVPISAQNKTDTVLIVGDAKGPMTDGLRVLNETPLAETTSYMAAQWKAEGEMIANLQLNVPVGDRREEEVFSDVRVSMNAARLLMPEFDLTIDDLTGVVTYDNNNGLMSPGFTGRTFDEPIQGSIESTVNESSGEIRVDVDGAIDVEDLYQWSNQLLLTRASGKLNYATTIHVPLGDGNEPVYVEADSDLVGVTTTLPAPLDKDMAGEGVDFSYRQTFVEEGYLVDMALGDKARASLKIEEGIAVGGRVHFGPDAFGAVTYDAIRMSGSVPYIDFEAWRNVTDELSELSDVSLEDEIAAHVEALELHIDELMVFELPLLNVSTSVTREADRWAARLTNEMLDGTVIIPDADEEDLGIHLSRLSFEGEDDDSDPFGDVDPTDMINIDFSTQQLLLDGEDYGSWSFHFKAHENGASLERLSASALGIEIKDDSVAEWRYSEGVHASRFNGSLEISDLAEVLRKFGYASSIEGQELKIKADVEWPGSPAMVDVDYIIGTVDIVEGEGRFVQAETGGALKLLGIFDFASIARRFRFDFSDVLDEGFEFIDVSGGTAFEAGNISVTEPIVIEGTGGKFTVGGSIDLNNGVLDNDMIVTLPVNRTLPWYAAYSAIATGPLTGAGVWLAQKIFENQIDQMSSAKYKISGTIEEPNIEFVSIFDDEVRETPVAQNEPRQ